MMYGMASRRQRRRAASQRHRVEAAATPRSGADFEVARRVQPLAYTRKQAAEALGVSVATFDRRVIPAITTVATEWGARLIPVSELERYLRERVEQPRTKHAVATSLARSNSAPEEIVA